MLNDEAEAAAPAIEHHDDVGDHLQLHRDKTKSRRLGTEDCDGVSEGDQVKTEAKREKESRCRQTNS